MSGEFDIIARYFAPLATAPGAFGLKDDAALFAPARGQSLVVTADAIVEGVHFLHDDPPDQIARKLLRVNLAGIAAKGAIPRAYVMTCAFPRDVDERWIAAFARGLKADQKQFGIALLGGDTVATPGPAIFSVTLFGETPGKSMLRRSGARPGDLLCVTGTIGDGGLGLTELLTPHRELTPAQRKYLAARYRLPQPRTRLGPMLRGLASAALDVSDGLVQDVGHIAAASGARAILELARIPLSPAARALEAGDPGLRLRAITAGDDYEIAFAIPSAGLPRVQAAARAARIPVAVIGKVEKGRGTVVLAADGAQISPQAAGFDHFGR